MRLARARSLCGTCGRIQNKCALEDIGAPIVLSASSVSGSLCRPCSSCLARSLGVLCFSVSLRCPLVIWLCALIHHRRRVVLCWPVRRGAPDARMNSRPCCPFVRFMTAAFLRAVWLRPWRILSGLDAAARARWPAMAAQDPQAHGAQRTQRFRAPQGAAT